MLKLAKVLLLFSHSSLSLSHYLSLYLPVSYLVVLKKPTTPERPLSVARIVSVSDKVFTACHSSHLLLQHSFPLLRDKAYFILFSAAVPRESGRGMHSFRWRCLTRNVTVGRVVAALDLSGNAWQCQWASQASVFGGAT